jgi:diguanylate cyclase (GGDEF)-like protein
VDVVETYAPMRMDNFIVGAFEIYTDISSTRNRVMDAITYSLGVLLLVLAAVFGSFYLPVRAAMVRLSKAEGRLREWASVDALTGIFNRRHVLVRVDQERARLLRAEGEKTARCMALLMVDIDYFKKVNDAHGHLVGDEVLRQTASRLNSALRPYDFIGRYGGEEFLVVLPNTDLAGGAQVAERMRACVYDQPMRIDSVVLQVSVSIGVATTLDADEGTAEVLKRADEGLYKAKASGRNRVCSVQSAAAAPG